MKTNLSALITLISVFFFWGFVAASNDILIPVFKEKLHLEQWQSQLISFVFYVAYSVGSLIYISVSRLMRADILNTIGYRNGIALGLLISAIGTILFYPAAQSASFGLVLGGLFIIGLGFSLQQTAANPLAVNIGDPNKGAQRLSLAGGINNIGTTIGPILISFAIFGNVVGMTSAEHLSLDSVKTPYLILGAAFVLVAIIFKFSSVPNKIQFSEQQQSNNTNSLYKSAIQYPQLYLGMIAIFVYVGVEVSTASNLPEFMRQHLKIESSHIAPYISLFWASLMIGRWTASSGVISENRVVKNILRFVLPYTAFAIFLFANSLAEHDLTPFYWYMPILLVIIAVDIISKGNPARQLLIQSLLGIVALLIGITGAGIVSVYAFISVGMFCGALWPCIFTLSIKGLGKHMNQGSNLLILMIMGGGIVSLIQGFTSHWVGIQYSYFVGVVCFSYLAFYAWKVVGIYKKQVIEFEL